MGEIPVQIIGLQKDDIESRKAELKFQKSLHALGQIHRDIIEARAIVKTSLLEKERRRYEVQVFIKLQKNTSISKKKMVHRGSLRKDRREDNETHDQAPRQIVP